MPAPDDIDPIQDAKHAREAALVRETATAHTPGPWRTAIRRGYIAVMAGPQTETKAVADCRTVDTEYGEAVANCTLIAAAPDLLDICRRIADLTDGTYTAGDRLLNLDEIGKLSAAAIRKATQGA